MYPAWDPPINAADTKAILILGEKANRIGENELMYPKYKYHFPWEDCDDKPEIKVTVITNT